jgi:hypothetical protein
MQAALPTPTREAVCWLRGLRELARAWVESASVPNATTRTGEYVDLTFAFALARIGAVPESEEYWRLASEHLTGLDEAHLILRQMFGYRIAQARQGQEHTGPLPNDILAALERMERLLLYVVDRRRKHSRLLEPDQRLNPYRGWGSRISDFERALAELTDLTDRNELASRVDKLLREVPKGTKGNENRARVLRAGLEAAPRVGEDFARRMLAQTIPAYDALPKAREMAALMDQATFLEKALFVVGHFRMLDFVSPLLERGRSFVGQQQTSSLRVVSWFSKQVIHLLTAMRLADDLDSFLGETSELILHGRSIDQLGSHGDDLIRLHALLCLAEGWYGFGWDTLAEPVTCRVWSLLLANTLPSREQTQLACGYIEALGKASMDVAGRRLEEVFGELKGIKDTYTTSSHFSVSQLDVVESVAFAAIEVCRRN